MKKILLLLLVVAGLGALAVWQRHALLLFAVASQSAPGLSDPTDEGAAVRWVDDYFTVQRLAPDTFAIGEPRYHQQNYSYLIVGSERAVLFDAGPGVRDIRPVAQALTDRPITFVPSHFHYDHIGHDIRFEHVAVIDLPYLRARATDGRLPLTAAEHLGAAEGREAPTLSVDEWLPPGATIPLGDRNLLVLHTPGHTEDSISLLDTTGGILFSGDFLYPGPLYAFLPNSGMGDYLQGAERVLATAPGGARIYGAHRLTAPGAPELGMGDAEDLRATLLAIRAGRRGGEGLYPVTYRVNARVDLLAEPRWLQDWQPRHGRPDGAN